MRPLTFCPLLLLCVLRPAPVAIAADDASDAIARHARVPEGLEVKVWAKAPQFYNPTNLDIDPFGRVWVTEAVNYRLFNNDGKRPLKHPGGDRVMVLQDTDGDGVADKSWVFVQDKDLTSPLGIGVIGNRVFVSCSPSVICYTDADGDARFDPLKGDKKEIFLTGFGGFDHDHGLHALFAGPDGWFHLNTGNAGYHEVKDKAGWTLRAGSWYTGGTPYNDKNNPGAKSDDGRVYVGGLAMRVRPDGTGLSVYGHNFRNNYEHCINSFGDVFQNDNDDEVMSCRTTWLMEYGNAGYSSSDGSRSWKADRRPGQSIQTAHWHQEDPGIQPSGDVYGAGAPTGMVVYENGALPEKFRGMVLSCEAGRNVVWGYLPKPEGAGFRMERFPFFTTVQQDDPAYRWDRREQDPGKWFRPSDVAVGADGAIYVTDWLDPVVGGHQMDDKVGSGTIYRVAPKGAKPAAPKLDLNTADGQFEALRSPAKNVRFLGFERLFARGAGNEELVTRAFEQERNPVFRARLVWLLAQLSHGGRAKVREMLKDGDTQTRLVAFRALRRAGDNVMLHAPALAADPSPAVRREVAISLRDVPLDECRDLLLALADGYDGKDRWYLEALGTGCDGKESALYPALLAKFDGSDPLKWTDRLGNLVWRLHPPEAVAALLARAQSAQLSSARRKQAVDALAFVKAPEAAHAMSILARSGPDDVKGQAQWWADFRRTNDWSSFDTGVASVARPEKPIYSSGVITSGSVRIDVDVSGASRLWLVVTTGRGDAGCDWADWAEPRLVGPKGELRLTALKWLSAGAGWGEVNVDRNCRGRPMRIAGKPIPWGIGTHAASEIVYEIPEGYSRFVAEAGLDNAGADGGTDYPGGHPDVEFLVYADANPQRAAALAARDVLLNGTSPPADRRKAVEQLLATPEGGKIVLGIVSDGKLGDDVKPFVAEQIFRSPDPSVRALASQYFPRTTTGGGMLPPVDKLLALPGDASRGRTVFYGQTAACSRCHTFAGQGADVGPDLTEIRGKYDKAALLDQILNPSASIALGYEPWIVRTKKGETHLGFILAEGPTGLTLKDTSGKKVNVPADQIDRRVKQKLSVMPDNVALGLKPQEIADLLAFLGQGPTKPNQEQR